MLLYENSQEYFFSESIFNKKPVKKLEKYRIVSSQSGIKNLKGHLKKHDANF